MNKYALVYDAVALSSDISKIGAFVENHRMVAQWSFLFPGAYLLKSENDFSELYKAVRGFFSGNRFFLVELGDVSSGSLNGRLSSEIWDWLHDRTPETSPDLLEE